MRYILVFLIFISSFAYSSIELSLGATKFGQVPDGIWYQEKFEHHLDLTSLSRSIGISGDSWRTGYLWLGKSSSNSLAVAADNNYNSKNPPTYCNGKCWPLSHWYGSGDVDGFYLGKAYALSEYKYEIGAYAYRPRWKTNIPDWVSCETCKPQPILVSHDSKVQFTPYVGLGYNKFWLTIFTDISARGDKTPAIYGNVAFNIEYRIKF